MELDGDEEICKDKADGTAEKRDELWKRLSKEIARVKELIRLDGPIKTLQVTVKAEPEECEGNFHVYCSG